MKPDRLFIHCNNKKKITKKVYNNIIKFNANIKMDTIFMKSEVVKLVNLIY